MRQVTLHIPDNSYDFFIELAKSLQFVKKIEVLEAVPTKEQVLDSVAEGITLAQEHQKGAAKLQTAKELLDEL